MNNKISVISVFEESWQTLKDKILELLVVGGVVVIGSSIFSLLSVPVSFLRIPFAPGAPNENTAIFYSLAGVEFLLQFINTLISVWLSAGAFNFFLKIVRKEEYTYKDLFIFDIKKILKIIGFFITIYILLIAYFAIFISIIAFSSVMLTQASMPILLMLAIGVLIVVAIIPLLAGCICVSQSMLLIIDGKDGVFSSITHSFSMMKSRILEFFLLMLASYLIYIVAILITCCIGIFLVLPWMLLVITIYYSRLMQSELPPPPAQEPKEYSNDGIPSAS